VASLGFSVTSSDRSMALGSTQPLVKTSTRNIPGGKGSRCVRLTTPPPSRAERHEIWEPKPPGTLWATPGLLRNSSSSSSSSSSQPRSKKIQKFSYKVAQHDNFQPGLPTSFQQTSAQIFSCLLNDDLNIIALLTGLVPLTPLFP
jgi:hypothetical protein